MIWLYASEHAIAHYLYSKEHPHDSGMAYAADVLAHKDGKGLTEEQINEIAELNSKLQSERVSGEKNPMYGKHHSEESRRKNSEHNKGKSAGEKNPMYGVHLTGELHPRYGKEVSKEQREKQSKAMKGKMVGSKNPKAIKVRCINTGQVFDTITEACRWCGLTTTTTTPISNVAKGKAKSAGKHPITKEKLKWEFVESNN